MIWIERVFANLAVFVCRALATDSKNVERIREREQRPREPILQSGRAQTIIRFR
jgi:hypothetical protein